MIVNPMMIASLRPLQSASHGEIGIATMEPTDIMALSRPNVGEDGWTIVAHKRKPILPFPGLDIWVYACTSKLTIFIPVVYSLETVHHRTVETVGCRDQNDSHQEPIELPKTRLLVPCDLRKRPASDKIAHTLSGRDCSSGTHFVFLGENSYKGEIAEFWILLGVVGR